MSVSSVKLRNRGMVTGTAQRTARDEYQVIVTAATDDCNVVRNAVDPSTSLAIPQLGAPYSPSDPGMVCSGVDIQLEHPPDFQAYVVNVDFTTGAAGNPSDPDNPFDIPPHIRWSHVGSTEQIYLDRQGNPIVNSAKQPFDPSIEDEFYDLVAFIQGNVEEFDPVFAASYMNGINNAPFLIRGTTVLTGVAKIIQFDADESVLNGVDYFAVTLGLRFRTDGWIRKILDNGTMELNASGFPVNILDEQGSPITEPVFLDGLGHQLEAGPPVFLNVDTRKLVNFAPLGIP